MSGEKYRISVKAEEKITTNLQAHLATGVTSLQINQNQLVLRKPFRWQFPTRIEMENDNLFIGSYARVVVTPGFNLTFDDLDFVLTHGADSGYISLCRDDLSKPNEIMLLAGWKVGVHELQVIRKGSSPPAVLAHREYRITDNWDSSVKYPRHWIAGELNEWVVGYTWGGGGGTPQNVNTIPATGTRNVVIAFVDTTTRRYPAPGAALTNLQNQWSTSLVGPTGSNVYYSEVSYNNFTIGLNGAVQVVQLGNAWGDNFRMMPAPWPNNSFTPTNLQAFTQAVVSAISGTINFQNGNTLIIVVRSAGDAAADNFFWPQAWGGNFTIPNGTANLAVLGMPDDWNPTRETRTITETCSHELGHNIRLPDLYTNANWGHTPEVMARDIGSWDLMAWEGTLPHLTISQRMSLGWIQAAWIRNFDFSSSTIPVDQTINLSPIEVIGGPGAGHFKGIEIRIADGWNYYFEYRRGQAGQIGDQNTPVANVVLGTDVISQDFASPISRPRVMQLRGGQTAFAAGQGYQETDATSMAIADFHMDVISINATTAQVRIRYGTNGRPDLYIRPWPGGNNWQSPDIEVRNARTAADPAWRNTPWVGRTNTVVATYKNRGPVTCTNVTVSFYIKDFTVANAPEFFLGSDTRNVPPESVAPGGVEFSTNWIPQNDGHKCIKVRTPLYIDASVNPNIVEVSDSNNEAQSNYSRYIAASASPAHRGITEVTLANPFPVPAYIYVVPQITGTWSRLYRMYLEETSALLEPGEKKKVTVLLESLYGDEHFGTVSGGGVAGETHQVPERSRKYFEDVQMSLIGYGMPYDSNHTSVLGGLQMAVGSGRKTKFSRYYASVYDGVSGTVVTDRKPQESASGRVLITFVDQDTDHEVTISAVLDASGSFQRIPPFKFGKLTKVLFHYCGAYGFAPCDASGPVMMRNPEFEGVKVPVTQGGYFESSLAEGFILDDRDPALKGGMRGVKFVGLRTPPGGAGHSDKQMNASVSSASELLSGGRKSSLYEAPVKTTTAAASPFVAPAPTVAPTSLPSFHKAMTPSSVSLSMLPANDCTCKGQQY